MHHGPAEFSGLRAMGAAGPCLSEAWASPGAATCSLEALGPLLGPGWGRPPSTVLPHPSPPVPLPPEP